MEKVLVGYDGSRQGDDAMHLAEALRTAYGSELLVAVIDESDPIFIDFPPYSERRQQYFVSTLEGARSQLSGAVFEERTAAGSVPAELERIATAEGVELIVVGSCHRGGVGRVLAGSVGNKLLQGAPCAVAVAPNGYARRRATPSGTIGVGYDGGAESRVALAWAEGLAARIGSDLRLVAVSQPPPSAPEFALGTAGFMDAQRARLERLIEAGRATIGGGVRSEGVVVEGDPAHELASLASGLDVLVVGSRCYGPVARALLGDVARYLIGGACPCPVVVHPRASIDEDTP